jgi:dynein heavy chain, axonemal
MVFEIHSLKNATPATVSRAGILYINDTDIGYSPFVDSWLRSKTIDTDNKTNNNINSLPFLDLFDKYLHNLIAMMTKFVTVVPLPLINMVQSLCYILDGILLSTKIEKNKDTVERMFVFAAMWAFGGALTSEKQTDYRKNFSMQFKAIAKDIKFPDNGLVFDYSIDFKTGECLPWSEQITDTSNAPSSSIIVPTADTTRLTYLMNLLCTNGHHVMFIGSAGTGKTILVSDYLNTLTTNEDGWTFASINMNFYTDSLALQQQLEQYIDKRSGKSYGPPSGRLIYFIDDLNLPQVETYGTQTPMALMRQHIDHRTWFDRVDMGLKKTIVDSQYVCCMNHKSGSFFVDPRLQRHFVTFACHMPGEEDLTTVFGTMLNHHFYNFTPKIQAHTKNLIAATISLHKEVSLKFLPSAVKFHYNFTMRDLANVIRGLLNSRPKEYTTTVQLNRLWYHEVLRVFSDRLVTDVEVQRCRELAVDIGKRWMEEDAENVYSNPVIFTHFTHTKGDDLGTYLPCDSLEALKLSLENQLNMYNESNPIMNLVLFEQAMLHVTRIARILLFPGGNALLVGVGGSGKQSLSKLAAFICGYQTVQITISADFSLADLKENLKEMYRKAGVKPGDPLMFLLTDSQIADERFLVYINDLLSSGRIPDLFTKEEYDGIFASLRNLAKAEGIPDGRDSMMNFFIGRVRSNLHVVLCFSPVGDAFRQRARKFPGIINCTSIDWFQEWPKDALVSVAQRFLEGAQMGDRPEVKDNIAYHMAEVHTSVGVVSKEYLKQERRHNYTTPKSFLELIDFYKTLLKSRRSELFSNVKRLDTGLTTLQRTNKDVELLQLFLIEKKKEVEGKRAATDKLLEEMGQQRSEAQAQQNLADIEKAKADTAANEARALEQQAEGDLLIARPALDAANEAVNCLDKASLTELKSFSKPPAGVDKVTMALLVMIKDEKKDFSWENAKKMMAKVDTFKEKLETYRGTAAFHSFTYSLFL